MILRNDIASVIFTSQMPALRFEECGHQAVHFEIFVGDRMVLDTELIPTDTDEQLTDDVIELFDIGRLMEEEMRRTEVSEAAIEVYADDVLMMECKAVYCPYVVQADAEAFVRGHFLTTRSAKRISPKAEGEELAFIRTAEERGRQLSLEIFVSFINEDGVLVYTEELGRTLGTTILHTMDISPSVVLDMLTDIGDEPVRVVSYQVKVGERTMTYFVDHGAGSWLCFRFRNAFNAEEWAYYGGGHDKGDGDGTEHRHLSRGVVVLRPAGQRGIRGEDGAAVGRRGRLAQADAAVA